MQKQQLTQIKYQINSLKNKQQYLINNINVNQKKVESLTIDLDEIIKSRQFYKKAIDLIYERSVNELKDLLNNALNYAFTEDRDFEMDIVLSDKRGKSLQFCITENGKPVNLKCAMGMGVKCVISAVLHMYYLQCNNSNILFLDETYSAISKEYVPCFFDFIGKMCEKLGFTIVMITHDERFLDYANDTYKFKMGEVIHSENNKIGIE